MIEPVINANYANFGHIPYGQSLVSVQQKMLIQKHETNFGSRVVIFEQNPFETTQSAVKFLTKRLGGCTVIITSALILTYLFSVSLQSQIGTIYFDAENPDMCQKSKPEALKEMVEDASGDK